MAESDSDKLEPPAYRMSRARVAVLLALAALPVLLTALAQPFLPDIVPLHYGTNGADRWGSKAELFVAAGIIAVIELALVGLYTVVERQRETGREDWIVVNGPVTAMFPTFAILYAIMACVQAVYLFAAFQLTEFTLPVDVGKLYVYVLLGLVLLAMLAPAFYMLITGKGLSLVNFHPGTSDLEKRTGADKQQARAIGGLLLFLAGFVIIEFMLLLK